MLKAWYLYHILQTDGDMATPDAIRKQKEILKLEKITPDTKKNMNLWLTSALLSPHISPQRKRARIC